MSAGTEQTNESPELSGRRDAIAGALNQMIEIYTSHSKKAFNDVMSSGLQPVAHAAGLDRIAVYRRLYQNSNRMGQSYVWVHGNTVALDKELVVLPNIAPIIRWIEILSKNKCINGNTLEMPEDAAEFCRSFGVKALFMVPIFTHGSFWGVVTLEDHTNHRYFDEDCQELLRSAARLCANAFIRNEMTQGAKKAMKALKHR